MEVIVRYNYRLRPGKQAEGLLLAEWDRCRWVWNQACERKKSHKPWMTCKDITAARKNKEWLRSGSVVVQQQSLRTFQSTKAKHFKSKKLALPSMNYAGTSFSIKNARLRLVGNILIPVVWSRELPSKPSSVRVYRDSLGHWYASFVVRIQETELLPVNTGIGVDWGVKTIATTTNPEYDLPATEHGKQAAAKLARYQRMMARRRTPKGVSNTVGYKQAKRKAALVHKKVLRQRQDDARNWAKQIVDNHDFIAVEDFKPKFLAKSTMARKAADNGIGIAKRELTERAQRAGRTMILVPPAYTTMTCSECLTRAKSKLLLSERTFRCEFCGHTQDRDRNAARVILVTAGLYRAGVEAVRHSKSSPEDNRVLAESEISTTNVVESSQ